jgi:diadenosine tetraphosphate (Ap4A) HIT family hydrolase/glutathione S-transferase
MATATATLFDVPVSNHGARCRLILYKKDIPSSEVSIVSPGEIGGLKSPEYLARNPSGKMPLLTCPDLNLHIAESDTIARYLCSKYADRGPSFLPEDPRSNLIARIHDIYISPIQSCLYKYPPFATFGTRKDAIAELIKQLNIIESHIVDGSGPFLCGQEVSLADATLFPTLIFIEHMLPKFDIEAGIPPKMAKWFASLKVKDPDFKKVYDEIADSLKQWDASGRWDPILGAGLRDTDPATLFDKIISGAIPAAIVKQDDKMMAFKDINPAGPAHVLIIPKDRNGLTRLGKASVEHKEILGHLMVTAAEISNDKSLGFGDGARVVVNDGPDGGQEVMHLHVHVIGGRAMQWPPG